MRTEWTMMNVESVRRFRKAVLLSCYLLLANIATAQKISTVITKEKMVIGEQVTLKISVEGVTAKEVQQDFGFPDTLNHLEILSDSIDGEGPDYIHTLTITSFDSGYWQFPSFALLLSGNRKVASLAVNITVLPVDISGMADYHDIKDILETETENNWWIVAAIVLLGLISLFAFLWFVTNKMEQQEKLIPASDLSGLYDQLVKRLKDLENRDISGREATSDLFRGTSQDTRSFIDAAYQQHTAHLTTGEYMLTMKSKLPGTETGNDYFQFLRLADAVKFAKYNPPATEIILIFPILRKIIDEVYQQNKSRG
jgi:uncharacterized protein YozE (UPF0346 family)